MACDHPSSTWSQSRSFQWGSGLEIGLSMTESRSSGPPSTPWLTWLCGMEHCPAGKNTPQSWGTLSEQKEASFVPGQSFTWLDSCILHKDKSARFQLCWSTPRSSPILHQISQWVREACRPLQVYIWRRIGDLLKVDRTEEIISFSNLVLMLQKQFFKLPLISHLQLIESTFQFFNLKATASYCHAPLLLKPSPTLVHWLTLVCRVPCFH